MPPLEWVAKWKAPLFIKNGLILIYGGLGKTANIAQTCIFREWKQLHFDSNFRVLLIIYMTISITGSSHYSDVIMGTIASQITSLTIVYSTIYSDADQRKHQSSASLAFVWWIHRGPVNSPHKWPVTRKMFPFDDIIKLWLDTKHPIMIQFTDA